ncbi:MAG: hypothetical protein HFF71_07705 [Oscillospiraceae bacterium]|nr:hypothetical protein [Oscillospiraceae bacterium]
MIKQTIAAWKNYPKCRKNENQVKGRAQQVFSAKAKNLQAVLAVFVRAYNRFGVQKHHRSRHPGSPVPFSVFSFL